MPDELAGQIPLVHRACEALGVPIITHERYEADDVIGTMTERAAAEGYAVAIVTGDKDFFQLVRDGIRVFNPRDEGAWYDAAGVKEKFGVPPDQVVDVLALMGDTIDNVKGVPGIGEKGARDLIATYGTLDALLAHAAEVPQKKYREALLAHADEARQSRELLRIHTERPGRVRHQRFPLSRADPRGLFRAVLGARLPLAGDGIRAHGGHHGEGLPARHHARRASRRSPAELKSAGRFAMSVLTDGSAAVRAAIVGLAFSIAPRPARYVPTGMSTRASSEVRTAALEGAVPATLVELPDDDACAPRAAPRSRGASQLSAILDVLKPVLEDPAVEKVGHDLKFDAIVLARHGVDARGLGLDTMLASYLLDATRSGHPLEATALEHLGYKALTDEDVCGRGAKAVPSGARRSRGGAELRRRTGGPRAAARRPAVADADDGRARRGLSRLEQPLIPVLARWSAPACASMRGARRRSRLHVERELARRSEQIYELAGEPFNINSPPQLSKILFDKLQLPTLKRNVKTKTASTAVEVLEELALAHDLPRLILEWRALQKLKGTYIDALPQLVEPGDGPRAHLLQPGGGRDRAAEQQRSEPSEHPDSDRARPRDPPRVHRRSRPRADLGRLLADRVRVLAHLADDDVLIEAFGAARTSTTQTALRMFGANSGRDAHELRATAKMVNYAVLYGKTAFTLAKDIGVTQQAAQEFIDAYFAGFPRVRDVHRPDARGGSRDRRREDDVRPAPAGAGTDQPQRADRSAAERAAVNMPIQGTAADIMKRAMIDVHAALAAMPDARMILTVHDELLFEVPRDPGGRGRRRRAGRHAGRRQR